MYEVLEGIRCALNRIVKVTETNDQCRKAVRPRASPQSSRAVGCRQRTRVVPAYVPFQSGDLYSL